MAYIYIVECIDGTYYTGSTRNLEKRIFEHNEGTGANYTSKRLPVKLVYSEEFTSIDLAFKREKQLQKWSHSKKMELIQSNYKNLKEKSKKDFVSKY